MSISDFQIAILYNDDQHISRGNPQDLVAIQDTVKTTNSLYESLVSLGYPTVKMAVRNSLEELENTLVLYSPQKTFIFNNCDGFAGDNFGAVQVIRLVEMMVFKHTGAVADVIELCIDKPRTKERFLQSGIPTPRFQLFMEPRGDCRLDFPVIVKPTIEDGSIGIDLDSVITTCGDLYPRIQYVLEKYQETAMAEEFIPGRELAVAMLGNSDIQILPIGEDDYSQIPNPLERLITYEAKWDETSLYYKSIPLRCPAQLTTEEERTVCQAAEKSFRTIGLRDFGRVDIRFYKNVPYIIEVNELPDLSPGSGFYKSAQVAGLTHPQMVERILMHALQREGWIK